MRRQSRLFALAEHLRGRRTGTTAEQLAERFGVSVRTIHRDLDALREASLPLQAERGRGGGFALDRAYTLPPINLSPREAAVLVVLGAYAKRLRLLPFEETLERGIDKVRGALSASAQRELLEHLKRLEFTGVPAPPVEPAVRRAVEQAWFEQTPLQITYVGGDSIESKRVVRIDRVLLERSQTLLYASDQETGETRPFRLDRITRAHVVRPAALGG
ncbi:MAG TPA: HTH domain-containing protein [Polyangiaceae bacterium]|jgi:predicted DNA-binding transcriptional regulator YafY|nr:HTH domain-containing protein [Polyangiaceae bacterium]